MDEQEFFVVGSDAQKAIMFLEEGELYNTQKEAQEELKAYQLPYQLQYMRKKDFKVFKVTVEECPD